MEIQHSIAIGIVWAVIIGIFLWNLCRNCCRRRTGVEELPFKDAKKEKSLSKYHIIPIFSQPSADFNLRNAKIRIELMHRQEQKYHRYVTLMVDFKRIALELSYDVFCRPTVRYFWLNIRSNPLPQITHFRAVHHSSKDSHIFFEGIEVIDQSSGERRFYAVQQKIITRSSGLKGMPPQAVRSTRLVFLSKEMFSPEFHSLLFETIGQRIKGIDKSGQTYGVIVRPTLNWFEENVFYGLLISLSFTSVMTLCLQLDDWFGQKQLLIAVSLLVSSFVSLSVTEIFALIYRRLVKQKFNQNCSPTKAETHKQSTLWYTIRTISLLSIALASVLLSIVLFYINPKNNRINELLIIESINETVLVLGLLIASLVLSFTLWLTVFAVIRYVIHWITFDNQSVITTDDMKVVVDTTGATEVTDFSTDSDKKVVRKELPDWDWNDSNFPEYDKQVLKEKGFKVNTYIGLGTYGKVFNGVCTEATVRTMSAPGEQAGRLCLVKWCRPLENGNELKPAHLLVGLDHPNVVQVFLGISVPNGPTNRVNHYIIMEYLNGGSLMDYFRDIRSKDKKCIESESMNYVIDMVEGLRYLHSQLIIHNDIHSGNMMFDITETPENGETPLRLLKYIDFNRGQQLDQSKSNEELQKCLSDDVRQLGMVFMEVCALTHFESRSLQSAVVDIRFKMQSNIDHTIDDIHKMISQAMRASAETTATDSPFK